MRRLVTLSLLFLFVLSIGTFVQFRVDNNTLRAPAWIEERAAHARKLSESELADSFSREITVADDVAVATPKIETVDVAVVLPARRAAVRAAAPGTLRELLARVGDTVGAAEIVGRIRDDEVVAQRNRSAAQVTAARARIVETEANLELMRYDWGQKKRLSRTVSESELVASQRRVEAATAQLEAVKAELSAAQHEADRVGESLERYEVVAPFSGHVTEVLAYTHQYVDEGDIVLWIESHEKQLKLHLDPERVAGSDRIAVSVRVRDEWRELKDGIVRPSYNPDGTITVIFELGRTEEFVTGQVLSVKVTTR